MPDALDFVKALVADYRRWTKESENLGDHKKAQRQARICENMEAVAHELEAARQRLRPVPTSFGDLSDLPEEVMAQLSLSKIDELEQQLRDIVAAGDGKEIGLDAIIIELYRRHKAVQERRFIMNKLYRMAQKGLINSIDGKKGLYYLSKPKTPQKGGFADDLDDDVPF